MGLFDLFKAKPIKFESKCLISGPDYLNGNFRNIPDELYNRFRGSENDYTWTRQLISPSGNSKFKIRYYGDRNKNLILPLKELPQNIVAISSETNEELILFDGAKHGYNAVFWQEFPKEAHNRNTQIEYNIGSESEFEIVILVRYSLDLKEQFDEDFEKDGFVENNRNEKVGKEAYLNGYDSISIFAFPKEGKKVEILSEETA